MNLIFRDKNQICLINAKNIEKSLKILFIIKEKISNLSMIHGFY